MRTVRAVVGTIGELLITAGLVILLYVVWTLYVVGAIESGKQADVVAAMEKQFAISAPTGTPTSTTVKTKVPTGEVFAILRIPRLGASWAKPVYEGVGLDVLANGLGHYPQSDLPGEVGNVAIAGHRAGHGNPLIDIDAIRQGDVLIIETRAGYYVYRVDRYKIVQPTALEVVAPVPEQPGVKPTQRWFTLTSCEPRYGSVTRYIVFSKLEKSFTREQGLPKDYLIDPNVGV
jgi:sortase A